MFTELSDLLVQFGLTSQTAKIVIDIILYFLLLIPAIIVRVGISKAATKIAYVLKDTNKAIALQKRNVPSKPYSKQIQPAIGGITPPQVAPLKYVNTDNDDTISFTPSS